MCKYCEPKNKGALIEICEFIDKNNVIYKTRGKYHLDASVSGIDNRISINYCPKCGRRLTKEN